MFIESGERSVSLGGGEALDTARALLESSTPLLEAFFSLPRCHFVLDNLFTTKRPQLSVSLASVSVCFWKQKLLSPQMRAEIEGIVFCFLFLCL